MDVDIGKDTLLALCAVAWADGTVDAEEAAGIRSAARQLGLAAADLATVEAALARRIGMEEVETLRLSRLTRLFTYSAASWIAALDGAISPTEQAALDLLGDRVGLSSVARERAVSAARAVGTPGARADAYDLMKLRSRLSASLSQVGDE